MPASELEYRFRESGLDQLRSDMEDLASDTEDVGESAQDTASDLEDMGSDGTDVAGDITSDMEDAEGAIGELGDEAQQTAGQMEEEFQVASDEVRSQIEQMSEDLTDFNEMDVSAAGVSGGGDSGGGVGILGATAGAAGLAEMEAMRRELSSIGDASGLEEVVEELQRISTEAQEAERELEGVEESAESAGSGGAAEMDDLANEAEDAAGSADLLSRHIEEVDSASDLGGSGGSDGIDAIGDSAEDAGGDMGGFMESAAAARAAIMAMSNPVTAIAATIAAVGTAAGTAAKQVADFANAQAEVGQQLKVIGAQSGVSGTQAQELFMIAQRLDSQVDLDTIKDAFKELALRTQEAREGTGEAREAFKRLGISMDELENKSTAEIFRKVRQEAAGLTKQQRMLTLEQIAGGEAGERLARVFELTASEYAALKDEVEDESLTSSQIDKMDDMASTWSAVQQDVEDIKNDIAIAFGPAAINSIEAVTSALQRMFDDGQRNSGVSMGPDKNQVDFGSTSGGEDTETPQALQQMREVLSQTKTDIAAVRRKYRENLIPKAEMKRQIKSFRQQAADQLIRLKEEFPGIIPDGAVAKAIAKYKKMRKKVARMDLMNATEQPADATKVDGASPVQPGVQDAIGGIDGEGLAADMQQRAANMRRAYEEELSELKQFGKAVGQSLTRSISRSVNRAFSAIGQGVTDMLFGGGGGGPSTAQAKLSLFNAKDQMRSMRAALRKGQMSYRRFSMKMKVQQDKIQKRQEKLNDSMQSGFAKAAEKMVSAFKKVAKQLIAEVIAVIVKMLVLKAITSALGMGGGGIGGAIVTQLGGGSFLDSGASGGMVKQGGLAEIHEDEQIMNAETVSMLDSMLQPSSAAMGASTPSTQPAAMASAGAGGGGLELTVNVTGQTTTDGRDLKTAYDSTARIQRRKGRK